MRNQRFGLMALLLAAALVTAACGSRAAAPTPAPVPAAKATPSPEERAQEMDEAHEAGVKAFPARTEGKGAQPLAPDVVAGVKVFRLTAKEVEWEVSPGVRRTAMTYNGVVPGPTIRVTEGDRVRVVLKNDLKESTSIHFHGVVLPNAMDGVPYITQPPVKPGAGFTYEFTARNPGSHMYHSHHAAHRQVPMGLLGAFIIEPKSRSAEPRVSQDLVMILNDGPLGYTINGKGFPATEPLAAKKGEWVRIRFMNEGLLIHPMHLHGMPMKVIAKDGYPTPQPYLVDTLNIAPGERLDVLVQATEAGVWAFHCHILNHAESDHGMHGMVTALIVK
ncbi:MAG: multicopper oxidase domain-containing protein [Armatimonadetes bacterium]|nr:multicopper oxidase domain-containing protein [Armatimonadota bacterium]